MAGKIVKLFNLKKATKEGVCNANRCTDEEVIGVPGDAWGVLEVELCGKHVELLEKYATEPEVVPPEEVPKDIVTANVREAAVEGITGPMAEEGKIILAEIREFKVETQDDLETINDWLHMVKQRRNEIEAEEKQLTGPLNTVLQRIRSHFRPGKKFWADAEIYLKAKIKAAKILEETANRKAMAAAAEAHQAGDAEGTVGAISKITTVSDLQGISTTSKWKFIIEDERLLPREFLMPNEKLIKEHCAHSTEREPTPIPGVKFIPDVTVTVRPTQKPN